jgi:lipopolysaccharide biosynthesis protein
VKLMAALLRKTQSQLRLVFSSLKFGFSVRGDLFKHTNWTPEHRIFESDTEAESFATLAPNVVITAHIHYPDFVPRFLESMARLKPSETILVSTSSATVAERVKIGLLELKLKSDIRVVPNIGRNFAPFLVEFSKELKKFEFVVHLHSKKSTHANRFLAKTWAERSYETFLDRGIINRATQILRVHSHAGLVFPDVSDLIRGINFRWGTNLAPLVNSRVFPSLGIERPSEDKIDFPAGGMFIARTSAIAQILDVEWRYEDFPRENGQVDGTLQHAVERLIGYVSRINGYSSVRYLTQSDCFTFEAPR